MMRSRSSASSVCKSMAAARQKPGTKTSRLKNCRSGGVKPTEYQFVTIPQFLDILQSNPGSNWVCRGQDDISWLLLPKAGRQEYFLGATDYWVAQGQLSPPQQRDQQSCPALPDLPQDVRSGPDFNRCDHSDA